MLPQASCGVISDSWTFLSLLQKSQACMESRAESVISNEPLLPLLSTPNLTTVTLSITTVLSLKLIASSRFRTVLHTLWLKLLNLLISHPSSDLCNGSRLMNALLTPLTHLQNSYKLQPANLTTYTILSLFSLHVEPVPHLLSPLLDHLCLPHYESPTVTCGINSLLLSVNVTLLYLILLTSALSPLLCFGHPRLFSPD